MKKNFVSCLLISMSAFVACAQAGVVLQKTRVIIGPGEKESSVVVDVSGKHASLVQSWLSHKDGTEAPSFTATPAVGVLTVGGRQDIKVIYQGTGAAPDRESLVYLNIQDTSAVSPELRAKNTISPAMLQVVKVFYRPKPLAGKDPMAVPTELKWSLKSKTSNGFVLTLENPTPFHAVFSGILISGRGEQGKKGRLLSNNPDFELLAPFSSVDITMKATAGVNAANAVPDKLLYMVINDFGVTEAFLGNFKDNKVDSVERVTRDQTTLRPADTNASPVQKEKVEIDAEKNGASIEGFIG